MAVVPARLVVRAAATATESKASAAIASGTIDPIRLGGNRDRTVGVRIQLTSERHAERSTAAVDVRLLVFGRALPIVYFAWLGYLQLVRLMDDLRVLPRPITIAALVSGPLPASLYLAFCALPVAIYVGRPLPLERDGRLAPRALALAGTLMVLIVGTLPQSLVFYEPAAWVRGLSTGLTILAFVVIISALLFLRRNLSLIPEARGLVVRGPYHLVRHPLYAAEIVATLAYAMVTPTVWVIAILVPFIATQLLRSRYEERLLTGVFPGYAAYARRTRRLIPYVW